MADDLVLNATMEFIAADRNRIDLAFKVEEAVAELRTIVIENVMNAVSSRLTERGFKPPWAITVVRNKQGSAQATCILKEDWGERCKRTDGWRGVRLIANNGTGWNCANISIAPFEGVDTDQLVAVLTEHALGTPQKWGEYVYCDLQDDLKDWNGTGFVFRAHKETDEIADQLTKMLAEIAQSVDKILATPLPSSSG